MGICFEAPLRSLTWKQELCFSMSPTFLRRRKKCVLFTERQFIEVLIVRLKIRLLFLGSQSSNQI